MSTELVNIDGAVVATRFAGPTDPDGPNVRVQITDHDGRLIAMSLMQYCELVVTGYHRLMTALEAGELVMCEAYVASLAKRFPPREGTLP